MGKPKEKRRLNYNHILKTEQRWGVGGKHVYKRGKNTLETMIDRQMQ